MPRKLKIASVQMDATPAPLDERLGRAADLVAEAAGSGAQLVVLPELFNAGYAYTDDNYKAIEDLDGQTVTWMKAQAADHGIHLAGTLLLRDGKDVYNTALLFAPDGQMWRYDKRYPFAWERAYFRGRKSQITIAETGLGKLGMMICWDSAHADLWRDYAGKVEAMIIPSCPPDLPNAELAFGDGTRLENQIKSSHFADDDLHDQAAWLNVPVVHSSGGGRFSSPVPAPILSALGYLLPHPTQWGLIFQARSALLEAPYKHHTQIIDASGEVVGRVTGDGDGFTIAGVDLPDSPPQPGASQPKMRTPGFVFWMVDKFTTFIVRRLYRRALV